MTKDFFVEHVGKIIKPEMVEEIWSTRPPSYDDEPETEETRDSIIGAARVFVRMFPDQAVVEEPASAVQEG